MSNYLERINRIREKVIEELYYPIAEKQLEVVNAAVEDYKDYLKKVEKSDNVPAISTVIPMKTLYEKARKIASEYNNYCKVKRIITGNNDSDNDKIATWEAIANQREKLYSNAIRNSVVEVLLDIIEKELKEHKNRVISIRLVADIMKNYREGEMTVTIKNPRPFNEYSYSEYSFENKKDVNFKKMFGITLGEMYRYLKEKKNLEDIFAVSASEEDVFVDYNRPVKTITISFEIMLDLPKGILIE